MRGILTRMATFFVALFSIFLLGEIFLTLRGETIQVVAIAVIVVTTMGWEFSINLIGNLLAASGEIVALQVRNLREFLQAHWQQLSGMGAYQVWNWFLDNPVWIAAQVISITWGTVLMMVIATVMNAGMLWIHRNKKASWMGLEDFAQFLQAKEQDLTEIFFILTSKRALAMFYIAAIISPDPVRSLQAVFVFFILFEIAVLISRRRGDFVAFFLLSFWQDSFVTTAYLRHGKCENGLSRKDYIIFLLSSVISVAYWSLRNGLIAELILRPILKV